MHFHYYRFVFYLIIFSTFFDDKLLKWKDEKSEKASARLAGKEATGSEMFVDSIRTIGLINNRTTGIYPDEDALYLAVEEQG